MSLTSLTGITSSEALGYIKSFSTKVKQMALNLTDLEVKVEEATNNEPWGPHGSVMAEITESAFDSEGYRQIMGVIARRLQDTGEAWRHVYKSLLLLEYMLKHGPRKVVQELTSNVVVVEKLQNFQYKDKNMKDFGENVRHRAKQLAELILDPARVKEERKKAKELKSKYTGVSSDAARNKGRASSQASSGLGGAGRRYVDDDEEEQYEPRSRSSSGASGLSGLDKGAIGASSAYDDHEDAVQATRARIDAMKVRSGGAEEEAPGRKKLSQVRPDPKVAASLGLNLAAYAPRAKAAPAAAAPDLMGGLDSPPKASGDWNAFESADGGGASAATAAPTAAGGDLWADFSSERAWGSAAAAPVKDAVEELYSLSGSGGNGGSAVPAAPVASAAVDPFGFDAFSEAAPAAVAPTALASTGKAALPEDLFSAPPALPSPAALPAAVPGYAAQPLQAGLSAGGVAPVSAPGGQPAFAAFQQSGPGLPTSSAPAFQAEASQFGAAAATQPPHVADLGLTGRAAGSAGASGTPSGAPDPFAGLGF